MRHRRKAKPHTPIDKSVLAVSADTPCMAPTAPEKRHMERMAQMPCVACKRRPVTIHHVTSDGFKRITRSHKRIVPLCATCHQIIWNSETSVEALGHAEFNRRNGIDLLEIADRLWAESEKLMETQG